jgi:hypothetical protein
VARMTRQPADWAFSARIWTEGFRRPINRPWARLATAIHEHGIPTITIDRVSTPHEIACQVVLKGYWHDRQRRASAGERYRDGLSEAGRAHSARDPCGQGVCGGNSA